MREKNNTVKYLELVQVLKESRLPTEISMETIAEVIARMFTQTETNHLIYQLIKQYEGRYGEEIRKPYAKTCL